MPQKPRLTQKEYDAKPAAYRGQVDGVPYLVYMDENGQTVYGPVEIITAEEAGKSYPNIRSASGRTWYA